jgi:Trp operon repressor
MKKQRIKAVALSTVITAGAVFAGSSFADQSLEAVLAVGQSKVADAQKSQVRINKLQDETSDLIAKFKQVSKTIEGLRVYNAQLDKQLASQREIMAKLEESTAQVTVIQRQIQPLVLEMLDAIEQFVQLDAPYRKEDRLDRIAKVRSLIDSADVTVAEKFRQVLEIYSIESEYARKVDTYETTLNVGGQDLQVNIVAIGRVALMYQTMDGSLTGVWDTKAKQWVELDSGEYKNAVRTAQKKAQNDIMLLPIAAPEAAK